MFDMQAIDVTKRFGTFAAVSGVSFEIPRGSFFSILGPSGCGKTTLMRMIAGFEEPTEGDIRLRGQSVLGLAPNKRNVKMVFQHLALFPMMSVGENIAYGLRCRGAGRSEIADRVRSVLDRIGLPGVEHKQVGQLSGGQKQRIAIARCMVLQPDLLLLDEPLGALDLKLREHMKIELKLLQQKFETTFLYITHDQSEALVMSDAVAVMNHGRFEQIGTPRELFHDPRTGFVAGFVGDSNCLSGTVTRIAGPEAQVALEGGATIVGASAEGLARGDRVCVYIRPEAIRCNPAEGGGNRLPGTVDGQLFNGAASRILVRGPGGALIEASEPYGRGDPVHRVGEAVTLGFSAESARCFPAGAAQ